jgi:hypothetical protein
MRYLIDHRPSSTKTVETKVVTRREITAFVVLLAGLAGAALASHAQIGLADSLAALVRYEPTTILLSGSLLLALGGALRRYDF